MIGNPVLVDVEALVGGIVEQVALVRARLTIELLTVIQKIERRVQELRASGDPIACLVLLLEEPQTLLSNSLESIPNLGARLVSVSCQVQQVLLLAVEPAEFLGKMLAQQDQRFGLILHRLSDLATNLGDELCRKPQL